eukprot:6728241-Karenia_brevis.AAC.1
MMTMTMNMMLMMTMDDDDDDDGDGDGCTWFVFDKSEANLDESDSAPELTAEARRHKVKDWIALVCIRTSSSSS